MSGWLPARTLRVWFPVYAWKARRYDFRSDQMRLGWWAQAVSVALDLSHTGIGLRINWSPVAFGEPREPGWPDPWFFPHRPSETTDELASWRNRAAGRITST